MDFHTFFTGYVYLVYKQYTVYTFDENQTDLSLILTIFIIQKKWNCIFLWTNCKDFGTIGKNRKNATTPLDNFSIFILFHFYDFFCYFQSLNFANLLSNFGGTDQNSI